MKKWKSKGTKGDRIDRIGRYILCFWTYQESIVWLCSCTGSSDVVLFMCNQRFNVNYEYQNVHNFFRYIKIKVPSQSWKQRKINKYNIFFILENDSLGVTEKTNPSHLTLFFAHPDTLTPHTLPHSFLLALTPHVHTSPLANTILSVGWEG